MDPEALRGLLARYFEQMKAIVERHGGTVEKFIGDAVMAVFGVPVAHEDDALRAVRAARQRDRSGATCPPALAIGEETDMLACAADAYSDLGEVFSLAGRVNEAAAAFSAALARYERKENLVMAERTRARLSAL